MNFAFDLNHQPLASDPRFAALAGELSVETQIDAPQSFNRYCRQACQLWQQYFGDEPIGQSSALYNELVASLDYGGEQVIQTPWGGVVITLHEPPRVERYLVIRQGGYLAMESHEEKEERLEIKEGAGLLLSRRARSEPLAVQVVMPGNEFFIQPGIEHCVIGTENLLILERSFEPRGMDRDIVLIYEPDLEI